MSRIELTVTEETKRQTPGSRAILVEGELWGYLVAHGNGSHGTYYTMQHVNGLDVEKASAMRGGRPHPIVIKSNKSARREGDNLPAPTRAVIAIQAAISSGLFRSPAQWKADEEQFFADRRAEKERTAAARNALAKETLTALNYWKAGALLDEDTAIKVMLTAFAAAGNL